jgi:hypothetical protein
VLVDPFCPELDHIRLSAKNQRNDCASSSHITPGSDLTEALQGSDGENPFANSPYRGTSGPVEPVSSQPVKGITYRILDDAGTGGIFTSAQGYTEI